MIVCYMGICVFITGSVFAADKGNVSVKASAINSMTDAEIIEQINKIVIKYPEVMESVPGLSRGNEPASLAGKIPASGIVYKSKPLKDLDHASLVGLFKTMRSVKSKLHADKVIKQVQRAERIQQQLRTIQNVQNVAAQQSVIKSASIPVVPRVSNVATPPQPPRAR